MTQAPWRCLSNKSNPYHLLALHSVSSEHGRDPIKSYCSLCQPWAQISCGIIVGCQEPPVRDLLWDPRLEVLGLGLAIGPWPSLACAGLAVGTGVTEVGTEVGQR